MTSQERGHLIARLIRMRLPRWIGAASVLAIALIGVTAAPGIAHASCTGNPALSSDGFIGTVIRLGSDDRQAFVQKDDGTQVEVDGGTIGRGFTGEDYTFVLGARYQIEPRNSSPPFQVDDCTATMQLGLALATLSPSGSPSTPASSPSVAPASAELTTYPTASAHPDFVSIAVFVVLLALLLAVAYIVRALRRRLHRRT